MNDYRLLEESLEVIQKLRQWVSADYYRVNILPTVKKLKDRIAQIETDRFIQNKKRYQRLQQNDDFQDTVPNSLAGYSIFGELDKE